MTEGKKTDLGTLARGKKIVSIGAVVTRAADGPARGEVVDLGVIGGDIGLRGRIRAFFRIKKENRKYARLVRDRAKEDQHG
jgi:hypothetical protein